MYIASVVEETGLSLAFSETPGTGFVASRPIFIIYIVRDISRAKTFDNLETLHHRQHGASELQTEISLM